MTELNGRKTTENGRDPRGRFRKGGPPGPGRPAGKLAVEKWRASFQEAISGEAVKRVAQQLLSAASSGERWAITELLNRCVGSLAEAELAARIDELEKLISERIP